jgi:Mrp family chromosome partitioning ATPase
MMNVPILGIVENMSYVECPDCGKHISVFGESHVDEIAQKYGLKVLDRLPINPAIAKACDTGTVELFEGNWLNNTADVVEKV